MKDPITEYEVQFKDGRFTLLYKGEELPRQIDFKIDQPFAEWEKRTSIITISIEVDLK